MGGEGREEGGKRRREMREDWKGMEGRNISTRMEKIWDEAGTHLYWSEVNGLYSLEVMLTV